MIISLAYTNSLCFTAEGIVQIYEKAVEQSPNNEEFLSHLFMACVRIEDYAKQQKVLFLYFTVLLGCQESNFVLQIEIKLLF